MKSLIGVMTVASALAWSATEASALPLATGVAVEGSNSNVITVADGCGWNRHFSVRWGHCVWNDRDEFFFRPHFWLFHPHFHHWHW